MQRKWNILAGAVALALSLSGCVMTAEEMYELPRRSESYLNLQSVMDPVMEGRHYAAPAAGDNQQSVQMADLDGDGTEEAILFTQGSGEKPLGIFVFRRVEEEYSLMCAIESTGTGFDQVDYIQLDGKPGLELVVGRRISEQTLGSMAVYRFDSGAPVQMLSGDYGKLLICDLDGDDSQEIMVISGGGSQSPSVVRYSMGSGVLERSVEVGLSRPTECLKRIVQGKLQGGQNAVFMASTTEDSGSIVTDVIALVDGTLTNISANLETGTSVQTLRNYYVYAEDIDGDGQMELPSLIDMSPSPSGAPQDHLIRWYAMTPQGEEVDKLYTYHNYPQGWYMELEERAAGRISVTLEQDGSYRFWMRPEAGSEELAPLWRIDALNGEDRSAVAVQDGRFVLTKTDTVVYACRMEQGAMDLGLTQEMIAQGFHLIQRDWDTGEM